MNKLLKTMLFLLLPISLTLAGFLLLSRASDFSDAAQLILQYAPYLLFGFGLLLGFRFNKSRVFFLCLLLGIGQLHLIRDTSLDSFYLLSFLLPVNFLLFSLFRERGIFSLWGQLKFGWILAQILILILAAPQTGPLKKLMDYKLIPVEAINSWPLPQAAALLYLLVFLFLCVRLYLTPALIDSAVLGTVLMTFMGFMQRDMLLSIPVFYGISGLLLIVGVVETSYFMAYRDELTGIPSRRALREAQMKLGGKYTIAMVDIDYFKRFNDSYGHDTGDEVLQMTAAALARVPGGGKAFRYGGEEFTVLFPGKSLKEALPHLEELRKSVAQEKLAYKKRGAGKQLGVTISIGVAEKSEKNRTPEDVQQAADKALYRAKKKGRNCVSR